MPKYRFSPAQRYAIWLHHEQRCWFCEEPLRLADVTVDHVIPESMQDAPEQLSSLLVDYDLPVSFQINGYENWLPTHSRCNSEKSSRVFKMVPAYRPLFDHLIRTAAAVGRTAAAVKRNVTKDKIFAKLATAIDEGDLSLTDLSDFLKLFSVEATPVEASSNERPLFFKLDNGYWLRRDEIAAEGFCACERQTCVCHNEKIYCYFPSHLSSWVQRKRLYYRCYDEIIQCLRCSGMHQRGHIGKVGSCYRPYTDQMHQVDTQHAG